MAGGCFEELRVGLSKSLWPKIVSIQDIRLSALSWGRRWFAGVAKGQGPNRVPGNLIGRII